MRTYRPNPEPYRWHKLSDAERQELLAFRKSNQLPWHGPPHFDGPAGWYLLTATNYLHRHIMSTVERQTQVERQLLEGLQEIGGEASAWVVLPNHYHLLAHVPSLKVFGEMTRKVHSRAAVQWNREDGAPGRSAWHRYRDRQIRGQRHYFVAFNYVHGNPVKHGHVDRADEWISSSVHLHMEVLGREYLRDLWSKYPPRDMGKGWDDNL